MLTSLAWSHVPNKFMDIHSSVRPSRYFRDSLNAVLVPCWRSRDLWLVVVLHVSCVWGLDMQAGERRLDHDDCCWLGRYTEWAWQWMSRWATDTAASAALRLTQHTHAKSFTTHTRLTALSPGLPRWASTRKVKPIWILLKQETVSGSGISWAVCKSAPCSRQITTPTPHHSVFLQARCPSCRPTNTEGPEFHNTTANLLCIVYQGCYRDY